jgi:hypothetical protein
MVDKCIKNVSNIALEAYQILCFLFRVRSFLVVTFSVKIIFNTQIISNTGGFIANIAA